MASHDLSAQGRRKLAASGVARPDGSYPISDQADVDKAAKDWIRTGRNGAVKAWIIKRARAVGATVPGFVTGASDNDGDEMAVAKKFMK
jgi:hypothetical protein